MVPSYSIVSPMDIGGWQDTVKNNNKVGGSLMLKSPGTKGTDSIRSETRSRLGSVPTRLMSPTPVFDGSSTSTSTSKIKPHKFLQRLGSRKFTCLYICIILQRLGSRKYTCLCICMHTLHVLEVMVMIVLTYMCLMFHTNYVMSS